MFKAHNKYILRMLKKMTFLPPQKYAHFLYEYATGKKLNLNNPTEFNEKIQWYDESTSQKIVDLFKANDGIICLFSF